MSHINIADRLVIGKTKCRAKTVGNIISQLRQKGYITTVTNPNYNGKNGGSSSTITVDEVFLEQMLLAVFNSEPVTQEPTFEPVVTQPEPIEKSFLEELEEMEQEGNFIGIDNEIDPNKLDNSKTKAELKLLETDCSMMDKEAFNNHLKKVIRLDYMKLWKLGLQMLIDNPENWELELCKGGLKHLIKQANNAVEV